MVPLQMYEDAMRGIHTHLISRTRSNVTYTSELVPEHDANGEVYVVFRSLFSGLRVIQRSGLGCLRPNRTTLFVSSPASLCLVR